MCGYFCIGFIDFMVKSKGLLDYTNLFFSNDLFFSYFFVNTKIFSITKNMRKIYYVICGKCKKI